jgi:hypothetical protein
VKVCRKKQKRPSNTTKSFQVKVDCTNTPAKKCKTLPNIEKKLDSKPVSKFSKDEYWKPSSSGNIGDFFDSSGTSTAEEKRLSDEEPASNIEIIDEQIPMPSTESSCSELKDQTLPNNDNQFDNKKQRINVKLQDRNVKQNSNPNASPNQSKDDFLSSRVKVCRKEQKRPSNPPAKKGKTDVVRVPIPSTESSCSELKDQALPNNDNRFDNKKENMDIKKELGNDTTKEKKKETESIPRPKTKDSFRSYFIPLKNSNNQNNVEVSEASPNVTNDDEEVLPLNGPNLRWYFEKGVNALANVARTEARMNNQVVFEDSKRKGLVRGGVTGNLSENIELLLEKLSAAGSNNQQNHLRAMLSIARFLMDNGYIVPTQKLAEMYKEIKSLKESTRIESSRMIEILSKHLNVAQVYIGRRGYTIENHGKEVMKLLDSVQGIEMSDESIVNMKVEEAIGDSYATTMDYLDSKRDRDTLKAVLTKITSINFMANIANVQDKRTFKRSRDIVTKNLQVFEEMKREVDDLETSLSGEALRRKKYRTLQTMKLNNLRHVFKGRGRELKCEQLPDLAAILEYAFGEADRVNRAGGGLESHPRLIDTVLYRATDSNTVMKNARETILALAPKGFDICLSSCYNYTQNFRQGTYQAKRHHSGKGINACISLHKPPRTGVEQFVVNLHWSTQNVNLTLDYANKFPENVVVDSKDAKAKIQADVAPVQKTGKTWKKITLPDHDWSRTTYNSVTPMTHLFLNTDLALEDNADNKYIYSVRRTGKASTLLSLSYFEPQTVQRVYNELFLLLINPALDECFRNPKTGRLKEHFVFIVDNGPSEAPSSPLVRMWLARIARVLKLKSVTQKSFAEYHSKRNPVERVHAVHNRALSNEVFSSKGIHKNFEIGDEYHLENMEHMAKEVEQCLATTQYGGKSCVVQRGLGKQDNFVFDDELQLVTFLGKNECQKNLDDNLYKPIQNDLWKEITTLWDLDENMTGSYRNDYQILQNAFHEEADRTCWTDKYSTTIFNPDFQHTAADMNAHTMQPIPDYIRWLHTAGEMHYLPLEKMEKLDTDVVDETPGAFLPSKILELAIKVFRHGLDQVLSSLCVLCWCSEEEIKRFEDEFRNKLDTSFTNEKERAYWSQDDLYKKNDKAKLQSLCKKNGISSDGTKHECVKRLVKKLNRNPPPVLEKYDGKLFSLPNYVTEIAKFSVYKLREILRFHNILDCGTKDELAIRVGTLRAGRTHLVFQNEIHAIQDIINATKTLIRRQKEHHLTDPVVIHRIRKFLTPTTASLNMIRPRDSASASAKQNGKRLEVPEEVTLETLDEVFRPIEDELLVYIGVDSVENAPEFVAGLLDAIRTVGVRILARWSKEEIGDSGWKTGKF